MNSWLLIILRGVLRAGIWLMDQGLEVGQITVNDIVFLKDDLSFEKPQIIDCLVTGRRKGHPNTYLKSVAEMIKSKFTKGNPKLVEDNPIIKSFVKCLEGHGRTLHGKKNNTRQEYRLLEHPLFLSLAQHCVFNDRVRDEFRNKHCSIFRSLDVYCVLDGSSKKSRQYPASEGWKRLFKQRSSPGVMQAQLNVHGEKYQGGLVPDLVKIFRDTSAHVTGSIPPARQVITPEDRKDAGKPITQEIIGKYIKIIGPHLLSYLFESYGTCDTEDKLR
ncbi:uncharacterized protein LOC113302846 isoform X1 [Papaver somniferum]|uniref:uncharacterized protein LOC113302846 isoform X1 n=1 Tax=Papaver somniferum TaxID=3469 RepID=UPI000E6F4D21|nr:uncharacterized protein LOC113302846 isoform X1 [Papaver somniferum]